MQDLVEQCPLPELAEALRPYIRPRAEVAEIRRGIDSLLSEHIQDEDVPLSRATLAVSETSSQSALNTPFSGVRSAFIRALVARQKAQAQYDALKTELGLLQHKKIEKTGDERNHEENPVVNTVSLIRQRQRRDKLLIIGNALDDLEKAKQDSHHADPNELLNGSMPPPPLAQQSQDEHLAVAQSHVFELQKAVLRAQSNIQSKAHHNSAMHPSSSDQEHTEDWKRAFALRQARDDLISWIEGELAKLSEEPDPEPDMPMEAATESLDEIKTTLQELYDNYLESRQSLIKILNTQQQPDSDTTRRPPEAISSDKDNKAPRGTGLASRVLPFVDTLRTAAHDEAALMQHTSYLRRQLTAVSSETDQLLTRLSDESHMVRPGTSHTAAWTEAAREARNADMEAVHANLVTGETSIGSARDILESAQG